MMAWPRQFFAVFLLGVCVPMATALKVEDTQLTDRDVVDAQQNLAKKRGDNAVGKVIQLLETMSEKIEAAGADEAAQYDKFACFCKEQADQKTYDIEKSEDKIKKLGATIKKLTGEISDLDDDVRDLGKDIGKLEGKIKTEEDDRANEHGNYTVAAMNLTSGIEAIESALGALRASRDKLDDGVKGKNNLDLAQLNRVVEEAPYSPILGRVQDFLAFLAQKPNQYTYQSNDIIGLLQELMKEFKSNKVRLDEEEFDKMSASQKKVLAMSNKKKFKEEEKTTKEKISAAKSSDKSDAEDEKDQEEKDRDADKDFRDELKDECEDKAEEFDKRSKSRAAELTAISEAVEELRTGTESKYGANKKLVGLATHAVVKSAARANLRDDDHAESNVKDVEEKMKELREQEEDEREAKIAVAAATNDDSDTDSEAPALIQLRLRGADRAGALAVMQAAIDKLNVAASKLGSQRLVALTSKAEFFMDAPDHYVKVRGLIKDLIQKLEDQATDEQTQKSFCDREMKKAVKSRDDEAIDMEEHSATIAVKTAKRDQLKQEIAELSEEVAELYKALSERRELWKEEKAEYERIIEDATDGQKSVEDAIDILEAYYNFIQIQGTSSGAAPAPSGAALDRSGKSVKDRAPDLDYSGDYEGSETSKGVIALCEVILADFKRTKKDTKDAKTQGQKDWNKFRSGTKGTISGKKTKIGTKEGKLKTTISDLTTAEDDLVKSKKLHKESLDELDKLKAMCVDSEHTYEERAAMRKEEIKALKQAMSILENYNK